MRSEEIKSEALRMKDIGGRRQGEKYNKRREYSKKEEKKGEMTRGFHVVTCWWPRGPPSF